jgi:hypothetical protein
MVKDTNGMECRFASHHPTHRHACTILSCMLTRIPQLRPHARLRFSPSLSLHSLSLSLSHSLTLALALSLACAHSLHLVLSLALLHARSLSHRLSLTRVRNLSTFINTNDYSRVPCPLSLFSFPRFRGRGCLWHALNAPTAAETGDNVHGERVRIKTWFGGKGAT